MPKNKGAGGKNRRRGKGDGGLENRELIFKEDGQDYALVTKMLGGTNVRVTKMEDKTECVAHIRGSFKKKIWIVPGDLVLVGLREFESDKGGREAKVDIIYKYTNDEARMLRTYGEIDDGGTKDGEQANGANSGDLEFTWDDVDAI